MAYIAEHQASVILSSHLVSDLERVCDYLIVLVASRVRVAGDVDELLASHYRLTGPRTRRRPTCPRASRSIEAQPHRPAVHPDRPQRRPRSRIHHWTVEQLTLEDLVLAYMAQAALAPARIGDAPDDLVHLAPVPHPDLDRRRRARGARRPAARHRAHSIADLYADVGRLPQRLRHRDQQTSSRSSGAAPAARSTSSPWPLMYALPAAHRDLLGRAADRPGTGDRDPPSGLEPVGHPHPLARHQARRRGRRSAAAATGPAQLGCHRPGRSTIDQRHRLRPDHPAGLRGPRHRPARLRRLRLHARRRARHAHPPDASPRWRRPWPSTSAAVASMPLWIRAHLAPAVHETTAAGRRRTSRDIIIGQQRRRCRSIGKEVAGRLDRLQPDDHHHRRGVHRSGRPHGLRPARAAGSRAARRGSDRWACVRTSSTTRAANSGPCNGPRPASSSLSPACSPGSASGGSAADSVDRTTRCWHVTAPSRPQWGSVGGGLGCTSAPYVRGLGPVRGAASCRSRWRVCEDLGGRPV